MERLTALLAVPEVAFLVDGVVTNHALLRALGQLLDHENALLRQVFKLIQEVSEVVLDLDFIFQVAITTPPNELNLLLVVNLTIIILIHEL